MTSPARSASRKPPRGGQRSSSARSESARPAAPRKPGESDAGGVGIVSSAHLVSPQGAELSAFEYGLIVAHNAFARWVVRCMAAAGLPELTYTDALVLHHVNHRDRAKKLADICFVLNVEDTHVVNYALKKLAGLGLVEPQRSGKEVLYRTSASGREHLERYRAIRERCLIAARGAGSAEGAAIAELADALRGLSGLYDQAARAASSL